MRSLFYHISFLILVLNAFDSYAQIKSIGIPSIVNHPRSEYDAGTQNWSITQSKNGFLYFANNDGILEYDGTGWNNFPVPNSSIVRSVLAVGDTIYSGAFEEIGFLAPDNKGKLAYNSLNHLIPAEFSAIGEVWNIFESDGKVIFQSFNYILIFHKEEIRVIEPLTKFRMLYEADGHFYVVDAENGLMLMDGYKLRLLSDHPVFSRNEIRCVLGLGNGELLIGTSNKGLFVYNKAENRITPEKSDINRKIKENDLYEAIKLSNGNFAFGMVRNGIYISNKEGHVLQHLDRYKGLQNNTVLDLFEDRRNNLWLGLDNGIDYLEISSPLSFLNYNFNIESAYTSLVHNDIMYVGTNQGLYAKEISELFNFNQLAENFELIKGTEGQVWSLEVIDSTLFCGHNFGCFVIDGFDALQISDKLGFWSFAIPPGKNNIILSGTYTGLVQLIKDKGQWIFNQEIEGFAESSRKMHMDQQDNLWVSHGYRGLFKLNLNQEFDSVLNYYLFNSLNGLPEELPYNIQEVNSEMFITTQTGIFKYDYKGDSFKKETELSEIFKNKGFIDKIHQDNNGNLWYFAGDYLGIMRLLEDGTYIDIRSPFSGINHILMPAFQNIYIYDSNNAFIGSQNGLIHYTSNKIKDYHNSEEVFIKVATFYGKRNNAVSFFTGNTLNMDMETPIMPFSKNSVTFRFTTPAYENPERIYFSYRLSGFDQEWSEWSSVNLKEYTNLREGKYKFQIKAVDAFGAESELKNFSFNIKPPILRSRTAYVSYSLILGLIILSNYYYIRKRTLKTRMREKLKHEKRLAKREEVFREQTVLSEKEIMHLRNKSLKNEMNFKNKELANATLHLIQKNKTLTYLKNDLNKLLKNIPSDSTEKYNVNNLLKKINRDLRNEKHWKLFNNYFDDVHQDFISRLRDRYKDLTPKELRLCAYLRMNISTKEIAPLMNISVRGVEISRYRLRKKLKLEHHINLTDFIMNF